MFARRRRMAVGRHRSDQRLASLLLSGLVCTGALPSTSRAQRTTLDAAIPASPYAAFVAEAAQRFGIPEDWIWAIMGVESRGRADALSPRGAMGLMQIMPDTWTDLRTRLALGGDPYDPRDNILAGAAYLRELHHLYDAPGFLAAYNAGPGRYADYVSTGRALPAETVAFVAELAPLLGTHPLLGGSAVPASDPSAWMRAPLFAGRMDVSAPADPAHSDERSSDNPAAPLRHPDDVADPQTGPLFVARSTDRDLR